MQKELEEDLVEAVRQATAQMARDLRSARQARRLTQFDMAYRSGMSRATYKRLEAGDPAVALGFWLRAWQQMGLVEQWTDALSPHRDEEGERRRRIAASGSRVRPVSRREEDWDY